MLKNIMWKFAERSAAQIVSLAVSIIIARILSPDDYGIIALVMVMITMLNVFVDSGLGIALVQKNKADNIDFSTVFFTNMFLCVCLYIGIFFLAPYIAVFYGNYILSDVIRFLGFSVVIFGLRNVQQAYVARNMMFKKFFYSTLGGTIVAALVGVILAYDGYGIWALVLQQIINTFIGTVILWFTVDWRPEWVFSFSRLKILFDYGWKLLISALLDTGYGQLRQLIIGKIYSPSDLAFYNRGEQFPQVVVNNINNSIDSVLLPTMSKVKDDVVVIRDMTRNSIKLSVFIMAPIMLGLAAISDNLVTVLLTDKWLDCVPYFKVFCVVYMFYPIHTANLNAIKAMGRSDLFLKLEIMKKIVGIASILISMQISVWAICLSNLVISFLSQMINSWPNGMLLKYDYCSQIRDVLPSILLGGIMYFVVCSINLFSLSIYLKLLLQVLIGFCFYIFCAKIFRFYGYLYLSDRVHGILAKFK